MMIRWLCMLNYPCLLSHGLASQVMVVLLGSQRWIPPFFVVIKLPGKGEIQHSSEKNSYHTWCSLGLLQPVAQLAQPSHRTWFGRHFGTVATSPTERARIIWRQIGRHFEWLNLWADQCHVLQHLQLCCPVTGYVWLLVGPRVDASPGGPFATGFGEAGQVGQARVSGFHFRCIAGICRGGCEARFTRFWQTFGQSFRPDYLIQGEFVQVSSLGPTCH